MSTGSFLRFFLLLAAFVLPWQVIYAQEVPDSLKWVPAPPLHYDFVDYDANLITHVGRLDSVLKKLSKVKVQHKGRVNIIHIGDSHLQADMMTSVLRNGFQDFFGDLGRGLVFPYQLANTNAPRDLTVGSNATWKSNRIGVSKADKAGICGFGIQCAKENSSIRIKLKSTEDKTQCFNRMVFFLGDENSSYRLTDSGMGSSVTLRTRSEIDTPSVVYESDSMISGFELTKTDVRENGDFSCYGVSLEKKDTCGVLYHTIGVNGARFDQFLGNEVFWRQIKALKGDLFIVSFGTNEAQNPTINDAKQQAICDSFVKRVHRVAPKAVVLFTTPAGSYLRQQKPNANVQAVSRSIAHYCDYKELAYWDLNAITDGATGAAAMKKFKLLGHDLVHYTQLGYEFQGLLLLNALANAYNQYYKKHPIVNKPKPKMVIEYIDKSKKPNRY